MLTVNWQGERLAVRRLLLRSDADGEFERAVVPLAARNGLELGDEACVPRPGDFWIGCHPAGGWGDADPAQVGWASVIEVPVAVAALQAQDRVPFVSPPAAVPAEGVRAVADRPLLLRFT